MRSRSSSLEDVLEAEPGRRMEARKKSAERRGRHREPLGDTGTVQRNHRNGTGSAGSPAKAGGREKGRDLSRDDLIFLLSLLEGELQARDEVITVLKADKLDVALLEAKYGFVTPQNVLQALQRDAVQGRADAFQEDIYQKPMEELDKLVEKQRETQGRMLQQLLLAERAHQRALLRLEDEKRNHGDFVRKSDEFTNLLEQERERLKLLVDQERSHQEQKERENRREVAALKEELTKLKSFALMLGQDRPRPGRGAGGAAPEGAGDGGQGRRAAPHGGALQGPGREAGEGGRPEPEPEGGGGQPEPPDPGPGEAGGRLRQEPAGVRLPQEPPGEGEDGLQGAERRAGGPEGPAQGAGRFRDPAGKDGAAAEGGSEQAEDSDRPAGRGEEGHGGEAEADGEERAQQRRQTPGGAGEGRLRGEREGRAGGEDAPRPGGEGGPEGQVGRGGGEKRPPGVPDQHHEETDGEDGGRAPEDQRGAHQSPVLPPGGQQSPGPDAGSGAPQAQAEGAPKGGGGQVRPPGPRGPGPEGEGPPVHQRGGVGQSAEEAGPAGAPQPGAVQGDGKPEPGAGAVPPLQPEPEARHERPAPLRPAPIHQGGADGAGGGAGARRGQRQVRGRGPSRRQRPRLQLASSHRRQEPERPPAGASSLPQDRRLRPPEPLQERRGGFEPEPRTTAAHQGHAQPWRERAVLHQHRRHRHWRRAAQAEDHHHPERRQLPEIRCCECQSRGAVTESGPVALGRGRLRQGTDPGLLRFCQLGRSRVAHAGGVGEDGHR
ncbi:unnamed protein product [Tetraodon nigroviridis]|uniref:Chromosome 3 SCAF14614, whole genome shotgun sequence n=1 Tax=Tetraodon nigroviridis TaxID=99883 RepID=Q4SEP7_TETNG|nr:unnamed protein product [Tetraodon nigroviridis]